MSDLDTCRPMPGASETLSALEQRLAGRLLAFERLGEAWPKGRAAIECAEIARRRDDALTAAIWRKPHSTRRCGKAPDTSAQAQ